MAVLIITLLIGLLLFFTGLSLVTVARKEERKEEHKDTDEEREARRELTEEDLSAPETLQNRTHLLGLLFGGEGLLLAVISAAMLLVHGLVIKIPLYFSIPFGVLYIIICLVFNSMKMYKE